MHVALAHHRFIKMDVDPDFEKETPHNFRQQVDSRIQYHYDEIERMKRHHYNEIQRLKSLRNMSSQMSRLSIEIFSMIVELCQGHSHGLEWIRLAQVCSRWRQVITHRPSLWTKISAKSVEAASVMLDRSGSAGVAVSWPVPILSYYQRSHCASRSKYRDHFLAITYILKNALSRIEYLKIDGPPHGVACPYAEIQKNILEQVEPAPIPNLRKLVVSFSRCEPLPAGEARSPSRHIVTFFEECAKITPPNTLLLAELRVPYLESWDSPLLYSNLKQVTVDYFDAQPSLQQFSSALHRMPVLETLSVGNGSRFGDRPCLPSPDRFPNRFCNDPPIGSKLTTLVLHGTSSSMSLALQLLNLEMLSDILISCQSDERSGSFAEVFSRLEGKYNRYYRQSLSFEDLDIILDSDHIGFIASQMSLKSFGEDIGIEEYGGLQKSSIALNLDWVHRPEDEGAELHSTLLNLARVIPLSRALTLSITVDSEAISASTISQALGSQPMLHELQLSGHVDSFIQFLTPEDETDTINLPSLRSLCIYEPYLSFQDLLRCLQKRFDKGVVLQSIDLSNFNGLREEDMNQLRSLVERVKWNSDESMTSSSSEHSEEE